MQNLVSKGVPQMFLHPLPVLLDLTRGSVGHSCPSAQQLQHPLPIDAHQRRLGSLTDFESFSTLCRQHSLYFICIGEYPRTGRNSGHSICKVKVSLRERAVGVYMSTVVLSWRSPLLSQSVGKDEGAALLLRLQRP